MAEDTNLMESFLDINLEDAPELRLLDPNEDVTVQVDNFIIGKSSHGEPYVILFFIVPDQPDVKRFSQYFGMGSPDDSETAKIEKLAAFREAATTFGVRFGAEGLDIAEFVGQTAKALVGQKDDKKYGMVNTIKSFIKA